MNYTKGQWRVEPIKSDGTLVYARINPNSIGYVGKDAIGVYKNRKRTDEEIMADAQLIAAAPAMYEALKSIVDGIDGGTERLGTGRETAVRQALAQAEGKK